MGGVSAPMSPGERVKQLRAERGWSAQRLADECTRLGHASLTRGAIAKIESGVRKSVTAEEIDVLGRALGVKLDALVRGVDTAALMSMLFQDESEAFNILERIGYPRYRLPRFESPGAFWRAAVHDLENGVIAEGMRLLVKEAAAEYPGNRQLRELCVQLAEDHRKGNSLDDPDAIPYDDGYPTLVLTGSRLIDEFLEAIRAETGSRAELMYAVHDSAAVRIADPGDASAHIVSRIRLVMQNLEPGSEVTFHRYPFRPYLLDRLVALGPDGSAYELRGVPATSPVGDVAGAVMQQITARSVRTAIDRVGTTSERLDPDASLHESGVRDGDELRISPVAVAGDSEAPVPATLKGLQAQPPALTAAQADQLTRKFLDLALSAGLSEDQAQRISMVLAQALLQERLIEVLAQMSVPDYIGVDASQILQHLPLQQALALISRAGIGTEPRQIEG